MPLVFKDLTQNHVMGVQGSSPESCHGCSFKDLAKNHVMSFKDPARNHVMGVQWSGRVRLIAREIQVSPRVFYIPGGAGGGPWPDPGRTISSRSPWSVAPRLISWLLFCKLSSLICWPPAPPDEEDLRMFNRAAACCCCCWRSASSSCCLISCGLLCILSVTDRTKSSCCCCCCCWWWWEPAAVAAWGLINVLEELGFLSPLVLIVSWPGDPALALERSDEPLSPCSCWPLLGPGFVIICRRVCCCCCWMRAVNGPAWADDPDADTEPPACCNCHWRANWSMAAEEEESGADLMPAAVWPWPCGICLGMSWGKPEDDDLERKSWWEPAVNCIGSCLTTKDSCSPNNDRGALRSPSCKLMLLVLAPARLGAADWSTNCWPGAAAPNPTRPEVPGPLAATECCKLAKLDGAGKFKPASPGAMWLEPGKPPGPWKPLWGGAKSPPPSPSTGRSPKNPWDGEDLWKPGVWWVCVPS